MTPNRTAPQCQRFGRPTPCSLLMPSFLHSSELRRNADGHMAVKRGKGRKRHLSLRKPIDYMYSLS